MRHCTTLTIACFIVWVNAAPIISAQATSKAVLETSRRNPDGWFSLSVPKKMGEVMRHVDVDGGFYRSSALELNYDYWTYESTPNWLRGKYATNLVLACPATSTDTRNWRTRIDRKRAVVQRCSMTDERKGFRYLYYVTFPKLRVFDGDAFRLGMFNLTVEYKDRSYSRIAARIIHSLDFEK
ncbi:MAG TPA: hypothetical protein VFM05_09980 [Candidatus Saccharimonadales bacterium]|nr:hypothetical protein [Candidatus Saccharimonadales bacterium]